MPFGIFAWALLVEAGSADRLGAVLVAPVELAEPEPVEGCGWLAPDDAVPDEAGAAAGCAEPEFDGAGEADAGAVSFGFVSGGGVVEAGVGVGEGVGAGVGEVPEEPGVPELPLLPELPPIKVMPPINMQALPNFDP